MYLSVIDLDRRLMAKCFWKAEVEADVREQNLVDVQKFVRKTDLELYMKQADERRQKSRYPHVCNDFCKSKGMTF